MRRNDAGLPREDENEAAENFGFPERTVHEELTVHVVRQDDEFTCFAVLITPHS